MDSSAGPQEQFRGIEFAIDDPQLKEAFLPIDARANRLARSGRLWSACTIVSSLISLILVAVIQVASGSAETFARIAASVAILFALLSALFNFLRTFSPFSPSAQQAELRYCTERLRSLHYDNLLSGLALIAAAASTGDHSKYLEWRIGRLRSLTHNNCEALTKEFRELLRTGDVAGSPNQVELPALNDETWAGKTLDAYYQLRFGNMRQYVDYKLQRANPGWWSERVALIAAVSAFVTELGKLLGFIDSNFVFAASLLGSLGAWFSILFFVNKTMQDSLQSQQIDTYRYQSLAVALKVMEPALNGDLSARFERASMLEHYFAGDTRLFVLKLAGQRKFVL